VTPAGLAGGVILEVEKLRDDSAFVSTVNQKAFRVINARDDSDFFENPLRVERSRGPLRRTPAKRINFFDDLPCDLIWQKCMRPLEHGIAALGPADRATWTIQQTARNCAGQFPILSPGEKCESKKVRVNGERTGSA
jgi:hypothetical protein